MTARSPSSPLTTGTSSSTHNKLESTRAIMTSRGPEFVAVVLASSVGTRLFPLASSHQPKHLLPVGGIPILHRLLDAIVQAVHFTECVVAIAADDTATVQSLQRHYQISETKLDTDELTATSATTSTPEHRCSIVMTQHVVVDSTQPLQPSRHCKITVVRLPEECAGSGHALRLLMMRDSTTTTSSSNHTLLLVPPESHIVVFPGDLIVLDHEPLQALVHVHRQQQTDSSSNNSIMLSHAQTHHSTTTATACTVLLTEVGELDEHGVPLKESAKQKKGGLAREDEEIEYIALSYEYGSSSNHAPRLVWKQAKLDVEEDQGTGATPKLVLPKPRLGGSSTKVRIDWNDVHVYVLSPWVRRLIQARESILSLREDLLPLLIARQFKGVVATFGSSSNSSSISAGAAMDLDESISLGHQQQPSISTPYHQMQQQQPQQDGDDEYAVRALVRGGLTILRSHTLPAYLYTNREFVRAALGIGGEQQQNKNTAQHKEFLRHLQFPLSTEVKFKFQTALLPDTVVGDKVSFKAVVVGEGCHVGAQCRLNNVILLNGVTVGDNSILQNTVVGSHASIGENCSLNDCQVGPNHVVPAHTKEKGESFVADNAQLEF